MSKEYCSDVYIMDLLTGKSFTGILHMGTDRYDIIEDTSYYMIESNGIVLTKQHLEGKEDINDTTWVVGHYVVADFKKDINEIVQKIKENLNKYENN